jgi:acetyl esterase/lipase
MGMAANVGQASNYDVFLIDYALCPEGTILEGFEDAVRSVEWLVLSSGLVDSSAQVSMLGISSGGGVSLHVSQMMANTVGHPIKSQALICPWVHYDWQNLYPSMLANTVQDLIVTQRCQEYVSPISPSMAGGLATRLTVSPLGKKMAKKTKTLIICSAHEVTADEDYALYQQMVDEGVDVEINVKEWMCH